MRHPYVVRIVVFPREGDDLVRMLLCEWLRCAGTVSIVRHTYNEPEVIAFDLFPPRNITVGDSQRWAQANAERIRSLGYNAQACPAGTDYPSAPQEPRR